MVSEFWRRMLNILYILINIWTLAQFRNILYVLINIWTLAQFRLYVVEDTTD